LYYALFFFLFFFPSGTLRLEQVCLPPSNCSAHSSLFLSEAHILVLKRWCNYMWKQYVPTHRTLSIWLVMRPVRAMQDRKNGPPWSITGFSPFPFFRHLLFQNPFNKPLIHPPPHHHGATRNSP